MILNFVQGESFSQNGDVTKEPIPTYFPIPDDLDKIRNIRILIDRSTAFDIRSKQNLLVSDSQTGERLHEFSAKNYSISSENRHLVINQKNFFRESLTLQTNDSYFYFHGEAFHGDIKLYFFGEKILLTLVAPLEDYLVGVLTGETFSKWTLDALKVQAVVSRTYAIYSVLRKPNAWFHVSNDEFSQVFKGVSSGHPKIIQAVEETRGEVLTFKAGVFPTYFHSTCGGHTTKADLVWDNIQPSEVFVGVDCPFCNRSPHYSWEYQIPFHLLAEKLRNAGLVYSTFISLRPAKDDGRGRYTTFLVNQLEGVNEVNANQVRILIGSRELRSTLFEMFEAGNTIIFKGNGWGHGSGLCQWGSEGMALFGFGYKEILSFYFPKAEMLELGI